MASIFDGKDHKEFYSKEEIIDEFKKKCYQNSIISATNLQFDFNGTFFGSVDMKNFNILMRGSDWIYAKAYSRDKKFFRKHKKAEQISFIDTMNYVKMSVEQLGKILNIPKLKTPDFIGQRPKNDDEWKEMIEYNKRDSEISQRIIRFFFDSFHELGATPKLTIASTAMSLYRNKYLEYDYFRHDRHRLLDQFNSYYGGNVHAYARGTIKDYYYYDFNSLYPSVMRNDYPDPNSVRINSLNDISYIESYEGVAHVDIECPYMEYPLLPYRYDGKLIFPTGTFSGWYSNIELRKAIELGYSINKVHKNYYFKEMCIPFRDYVEDMYDLRRHYKENNNPMQIVVKLLMNSLYGKFGQKFEDKEEIVPFDHTIEELDKLKDFEVIGDFLRIKKDFVEPAIFCIPIWALYTTAYARLKLHEWILRTQPAYVDTDSLITRKKLHSSDRLGELKLEGTVKKGIIVKPKFYMTEGSVNNYKIKGIGVRVGKDLFMKMMTDPKHTYKKFMKFKESIRRGFIPNEIIDMTKEMSLEDNKRFWKEEFKHNDYQISRPIEMIDGISELEIGRSMEKKIEVGC